jgi:hypothetical protein
LVRAGAAAAETVQRPRWLALASPGIPVEFRHLHHFAVHALSFTGAPVLLPMNQVALWGSVRAGRQTRCPLVDRSLRRIALTSAV